MAKFTAEEWDDLRNQYGVEKVTSVPGNPHCFHSPFRARTPLPRSFFSRAYPLYPNTGVYSKIYAALQGGTNPWETKSVNDQNHEGDDDKDTNGTPMTHEVRIIDGLDGEENLGEHAANMKGLGDEVILIEDTPNKTEDGNDDGDDGDAGSAAGVLSAVALPCNYDYDPFSTPDRKTKSIQSPKQEHGGLTTHGMGSDSTIRTKGSIEEYSSNTSCESAVAKLTCTLGQSGCHKVSKSDVESSDFDAMTPDKIDWKGLASAHQSSSSCVNVKMGGSHSNRPHPYLKHP